jgi:hypothetical protein
MGAFEDVYWKTEPWLMPPTQGFIDLCRTQNYGHSVGKLDEGRANSRDE